MQARLDSSRLPGKATLPLGGKPIVSRVMEALNQVPADLRILACPEDSVSSLSRPALDAGFEVFAGPKEDVLERFVLAIKKYNLSRVIRATADNPFVFADAAFAINAESAALGADYAGYAGLPLGAGVEAVSAAALLRAGEKAASLFDREHVCPYLYSHPEVFKIHRPLSPVRWQADNIRLTIDTPEDYDRASRIYASLKDEPFRYHGPAIIRAYKELFQL